MTKPSETMQRALGSLSAITTTGDLRRIVANAMLAHARGEIANNTLESLAKGLDAVSNSLQAEVKIAKLRHEMRKQGGQLGKHDEPEAELGALGIGTADHAKLAG